LYNIKESELILKKYAPVQGLGLHYCFYCAEHINTALVSRLLSKVHTFER